MRIPTLALALAPAAIGVSAPAAAQLSPMLAYPAMQQAGTAYVVEAGEDRRITACRPVDPAAEAAGCAALTAKGVPATVVPARAATAPASWVAVGDFSAELAQAARGRTLELIFEIDQGGLVSDCRAYASSGNAQVDAQACASLVARARFTPATYKGQPVPAAGIRRVRFP